MSKPLKDRIVAWDLDGVLCKEACWTIEDCKSATPNEEMIEKLTRDYQEGFIVIYTARKDELVPATFEWLRRNNIRFHAFSNIKIPADSYIDDHAVELQNA